MATTRLIPMHVIKGQPIAQTVHERLAYAMNPDKTEKGTLVSAFGCDSATAAAEMLLCKKQHEILIGRADEDCSDVLLYQIRQSFKPGEVTPELAQKIGHELAMRFTKGRHQFVVTTHVDHAHIHNHIIFNATSIDGTQKFRNFMGSSKAIRGISDRLCLENGLSIVEQPKVGHTHYGKWLGDKKPKGWHDKLRAAIDTILASRPPDFDAFLDAVKSAGYEVRPGESLAFREAVQKRFIRLTSLGEGYAEDDIRAVISGDKPHTPKSWALLRKSDARINLLVELQQTLQARKGPGYARWAKVFNLKQMAKALDYLMENRLNNWDELVQHVQEVTEQYYWLSADFHDIERQIAKNRQLLNHIANYARTRDVYMAYRQSLNSRAFASTHDAELKMYEEAVSAFSHFKKKGRCLPKIRCIQDEQHQLKLKLRDKETSYKVMSKTLHDLYVIKRNVYMMTGPAHTIDHNISIL